MAYEDEVLADSPWLYWRLNDQTGTQAVDSSGNSRDGTYVGGPTLAQAGAIASDPTNDSVSYDASNDYTVNEDTPDQFFNSSAATVEVWYEYSGTPPASDALIAGCWNQGGTVFDKDLVLDSSGRVRFTTFDGSARETSVSPALSAGWHHIVGTVPAGAGGTSRCYVDGVEVGTFSPQNGSYNTYNVDANVHIAGTTTRDIQLAGKRDEFAIYTTELSAARILAHYEAAAAVAAGIEYKRFFGPALLTNVAADLYTVPTGKRSRVLNIHASNPTASPVDLTLSIGTDAAATRVYDDFRVPADSIESNYDPYDMAAGEKIQGLADTNGVMNLTITGYEEDE